MYTFPFFYKTKILLADVSNQKINISVILLNTIKTYGLYVKEYNENEFFFTFGISSFRSKLNNGTSGIIKILKEDNKVYAVFYIYNKMYSIVTYIVFGVVLMITNELIISLFSISLFLIFFSVQFYPFVFKFIKTCRESFRKN